MTEQQQKEFIGNLRVGNLYAFLLNLKLRSGSTNPIKVKESEVTQLCLTLCDPMDCSLLGSSVHGIFQVKVLKWVAISFSNHLSIFPIYMLIYNICFSLYDLLHFV